MYDPLRESYELRDQLASATRRLAFLFGAGTSQAVGLPGIDALTNEVGASLTGDENTHYDRLLADAGTGANVEHVLDKVRLCRELIGTSEDLEVHGLRGTQAKRLDREICRAIVRTVSINPPGGIAPHIRFAHWSRSIPRDWPVEVFTTNYDVLIERGLEAAETPHFDGFVGSVAPHFSSTSVEADNTRLYESSYPPRSWVRVWKLHGSISWRLTQDPVTTTTRIIRAYGPPPGDQEDLLIFPSRQKYSDSRKLPFIAYHDRLRRILSGGAILLVVIGYSFGDQHLNEIIFEALRNNHRLSVAALIYGPLSNLHRTVLDLASSLRNLSLYGPDQACIGGLVDSWNTPSRPPVPPLSRWPFWDGTTGRFTLGDFSSFTEFLDLLFLASPVTRAP